MSCLHPLQPVQSRRHKLAPKAKLDPVEVDGTWDFKWRKNTVIRVAFQLPPPSDAARAVYQQSMKDIVKIAGRWQTHVRSDYGLPETPEVPLTLHFLTDLVPPPPPEGCTWLPVGVDQAVRYDVLISLATLPVVIPEGSGRKRQEVILPRAELGRYARRLEYGAPTAYLGAFRHGQNLAALSETKEWEHIVLHEFGHILGLAHPHQQHNARVTWKTDKELKRILPGILERDLTDAQAEDFIDLQLKARLPAPAPKGPSFSDDWEEPGARSVMNPPFVSDLVDGGPFERAAAKADGGDGDGRWLTIPTDADRAHLQRMYPASS